jgi:hypothetical protein
LELNILNCGHVPAVEWRNSQPVKVLAQHAKMEPDHLLSADKVAISLMLVIV